MLKRAQLAIKLLRDTIDDFTNNFNEIKKKENEIEKKIKAEQTQKKINDIKSKFNGSR